MITFRIKCTCRASDTKQVPVIWNMDWNPNPNFPTLRTSSSLLLWLILPSDVQSLSLNTALFHAYRAGPWDTSKLGNMTSSVGWCRQSIKNPTCSAWASSAFWINSYQWIKITSSHFWEDIHAVHLDINTSWQKWCHSNAHPLYSIIILYYQH